MNHPISGPKVAWKTSALKSLSTSMEFQKSIINESMAEANFEKIVEYNNLKPVAFLEQGIKVSRSVAHITREDGGMASGFLIAPDVLLTNWHVFPEAKDAKNAKIRFNYQNDLLGNFLPTEEYELHAENLFKSDEELDYAVIRVKGEAGLKWGYLKLKAIEIQVEQKVNIIQHPAGGPKQIAMNDNEIKYVDNRIVQYITDTLPGSSGSPVFNEEWQIVALHHSGGNIPEPSTNSIHFRNEGIRIAPILKDLPSLK
jgi:V8-like Glu-specific endopeptidase